ncbi:MAG TPA: DMT family transporter, partial [Verrucomicrobiae bacterium]|nr:DMT family transporter [Verrucomicrobiae bacterium]
PNSPPARRRCKIIVIPDASTVSPARHRKAITMLLVATFFWASSFPIVKALALEQQKFVPAGSTWFFAMIGALYRFGVAGLLLAVFLHRELLKITRLELEQGFGLAAFGIGGILFQMDGLSYTAASTSAFLTQLYVAFIPVWVALVHQHLPSPKVIVSLALVLVGLAILADLDFKTFKLGRGEAETLMGSILFGGQILMLERPCYAANDPLRFSVVMFVFMALFCVPGVGLTAPNAAACLRAFASPASLGFLAALVLVCTLGGYLFMNRWQRDVTATEAGLIYCVEPVITSVLALFLPGLISIWAGINYPNETLTTRLLIGGGLVTAANVLLQKR